MKGPGTHLEMGDSFLLEAGLGDVHLQASGTLRGLRSSSVLKELVHGHRTDLRSAVGVRLTKALTSEGGSQRFRRLGTFAVALSPSRCSCVGCLAGGQGEVIRNV